MEETSNFGALFRKTAKNERLLAAIQNGTRHRSDIAAAMNVSEKTVYRRTRELHEEGIVERDGSCYRLTNLGQLYTDVRDEFEELVQRRDAIHSVFSDLPCDRLPPHRVLADAKITRARPHAPSEPVRRTATFVRRANRLDGLLSAVPPPVVEAAAASVADDELHADLVLTSTVAAHLRREYPIEVERLGDATLRATDADVPLCVLICERAHPEVVVLVHDDHGFTGTIHSESSAAVEWATALCRKYRRAAEPVT